MLVLIKEKGNVVMQVNMFQKPVFQNRLAFSSNNTELKIGERKMYKHQNGSGTVDVVRNPDGSYTAAYRGAKYYDENRECEVEPLQACSILDHNPVLEADDNGTILDQDRIDDHNRKIDHHNRKFKNF